MGIKCQNCGAHVSDRFGRVFGDQSDVVHCCPDCEKFKYIQGGAAAGLDATGNGL